MGTGTEVMDYGTSKYYTAKYTKGRYKATTSPTLHHIQQCT